MSILTKEEAEIKLIESLPNDIKMLSNFFQLDGKKLYLVGGCIRDTFLGKAPKDFDVCTDALPESVMKILDKNKITYNLQGEHFAVVVAKMDDGDYEIATFREDIQVEGDNRHPEIRLGVTIQDDVKRRDFTINALFMDLQERNIIDLVGGINDLDNELIRCVGNPIDRFNEDHLRKLRAIRFAARLGFNIVSDTFDAIYQDPDLNISGERIVNELTVAFNTCKNADDLVCWLYSTRLVDQIFRGIIINDKNDINTNNITSFNMLVASIVCTCNQNIAKLLVAKNYTLKTAESVEFLHNCVKVPVHDIKPLHFFNKRKSTNLTDAEISIYNNETDVIKWLIDFTPDSGLSEALMSQGYKGKELGEKINRTYQDAFVSAINRTPRQHSEI